MPKAGNLCNPHPKARTPQPNSPKTIIYYLTSQTRRRNVIYLIALLVQVRSLYLAWGIRFVALCVFSETNLLLSRSIAVMLSPLLYHCEKICCLFLQPSLLPVGQRQRCRGIHITASVAEDRNVPVVPTVVVEVHPVALRPLHFK